MKTKLEMAHDYAIALINSDCEMQFDKFIQLCWNYADAMQAEADKREKEEQDKLEQNERNHHDALVEIGLEEWQPDWSQAPDWAKWWAIDKIGQGFWYNLKPSRDQSATEWIVDFSSGSDFSYKASPDFNYQGNWRNSLRKRPQ